MRITLMFVDKVEGIDGEPFYVTGFAPGFPALQKGMKLDILMDNQAPEKWNVESYQKSYVILDIKHSFEKAYTKSGIVETMEECFVTYLVEESL